MRNVTNNKKYEVVVQSIRKKIASGTLKPGDKLLGERRLTADYGVSAITTKRALNELQRLKLVVRHKRSGTFVSEDPQLVTRINVLYERCFDSLTNSYWEGVVKRSGELGVSCNLVPPSVFWQEGFGFNPDEGDCALVTGNHKSILKRLSEWQVPTVVVGAESEFCDYCVMENRHMAAFELVLTMGHDCPGDIAFIGDRGRRNHEYAREGYVRAILETDRTVHAENATNSEEVVAAVRRLMSLENPPDGILVMGGTFPLAAIPEILLHSQKMKVGLLTENSHINYFRHFAYLGQYDREEVGAAGVDLLKDVCAGKVKQPIIQYAPFDILTPDKPLSHT